MSAALFLITTNLMLFVVMIAVATLGLLEARGLKRKALRRAVMTMFVLMLVSVPVMAFMQLAIVLEVIA